MAEVIQSTDVYPSPAQAEHLKGLSGGTGKNSLTKGMIHLILSETKPTPIKVTLKEKKQAKYFRAGISVDDMEARIIELLEMYGGI